MAIGIGIEINTQPQTFAPDGIWYAAPLAGTFAAGQTYVVNLGLDFDLSWQGKTHRIKGGNSVELTASGLVQAPLQLNQEFELLNDDKFRIFRYTTRGVEVVGGGELIIQTPVVAVTATIPASIKKGFAHIITAMNPLFPGRVRLGEPVGDDETQITWRDLPVGARFMLEANRGAVWQLFDGNRTYADLYPVPFYISTIAPIDMGKNPDGSYRLTADALIEAFDTYRGAKQVIPRVGVVNLNPMVLHQSNKVENGAYQIQFRDGIVTDIIRLRPFIDGVSVREGEVIVTIGRGDANGDKTYGIVRSDPVGTGVQTILFGTTPHTWIPVDRDRIEIEALRKQIAALNALSTYTPTTTAGITAQNGQRIAVEGAGDIALWNATEGQWLEIVDPKQLLATLSVKVVPTTEYTIGGSADTLDLIADGAEWTQERAIKIICDANKNWSIIKG